MRADDRINDEQLSASDIRQLENADEVARFFARLHYDVDGRINISDYGALGLGSEDLRQQIQKLERIAIDPVDGDITIYLFEVRSVTAKLRNEIARRFRERPENALLVLTRDYAELEFVMLQKSEERGRNRIQSLRLVVRPVPLTVNRLNPDPVALRVLKRFTFTEEDAGYQWEKLRSAYMLAEWSEAYFNNRALFSDYYLKERFTDPRLTPEWNDDVRPVGREVAKHLATARKAYSSQPEAVIRQGLYEPLFTLLGFAVAAQKPGSSALQQADYLLHVPDDPQTPIAAALTYVWNRNLDDVDETREPAETAGGTPLEIPGATVVSLLEAQVAPWVIVTNGKLWRLYSATASNKATNYYEIDLEEAVAASDQIAALKYWWLLFRRQAFTGFLDALLKNSAEYAKELGDRLKDRVFVHIFPEYAQGFIADMRVRGIAVDAGTLTEVFSGTMTFLYRLMFILYAESLELLPINEAHGYRERSVYRLKHEIAHAGGTLLDAAPDKLRQHYKAGSTALYARLQALFEVIDRGSDELNMPTYNGGLFSPHTPEGQFLATYAIPDRYLAPGLDRLTRDVDTQTQALAFIDFKSLGVRQLGSIYEGLLEFKLRIAAETLAVTREKGKEVYQPFAAVKKPLATIEPGAVYLENDKRERKATGSYYTPDYIVKYIVQHTVGPVLNRTFAALEARLRAAQKGYRDYDRLVQAREKSRRDGRDENGRDTIYGVRTPNDRQIPDGRDTIYGVRTIYGIHTPNDREIPDGRDTIYGIRTPNDRQIPDGRDTIYGIRTSGQDSAAAFWNEPAMRQLVDDCLNVRVLDPAMGSGHFLVEVVDYVSNRLISFLNGWSENPVWAFIDQTRSDIVQEMERQRVTIDPDRLTRVALLKRAVLKRCIYGVDLNAMAVELAKVALWLDAFTLGAPLSFLDHHLKHGNSLIGARIADVQAYLDVGGSQMHMLEGSEFTGIMLATDLMRQVSFLSDNTVEQSQQSAAAYRNARDHLAPYKRMLDVYTSRWFGNEQPKKAKTDSVSVFLRDPRSKAWFHDPATPLDDALLPATQIATTAQRAAAEKRFFHWELEFPEVFFAPSTRGGQDVQLIEGGGFDAVVGNPPWTLLSDKSIMDYTSNNYSTVEGKQDTYRLFMEQSIRILHSSSRQGFVVPSSFLSIPAAKQLRSLMMSKGIAQICKVETGAFEDVSANILVYILDSQSSENNQVLILDWQTSRQHYIPQSTWDSTQELVFQINTTSREEEILAFITNYSKPLSEEFDYVLGMQLYHNTTHSKEEMEQRIHHSKHSMIGYQIELGGTNIGRYAVNLDDVIWVKVNPKKAYSLPDKVYFSGSRILIREIPSTKYLIAALVNTSDIVYSNKSTLIVKERNSSQYKLKFLLSILNSNLTFFSFNLLASKSNQVLFPRLSLTYLRELPIRRINFTTPAAEREQHTQQAIGAYDLGDNAGVVGRAQAAIAADQTDVVHDLLAHLAQRMIDLNKTKQAEIKRFLRWVETRLAIRPDKNNARGIDSLKGKSIIQNYLGDYQKNQAAASWREFHFRLHENRNRYAVPLSQVEGEIEREYERSLATLEPIKRDLARTDALIDKIVYRLYGLTDAEIELIERPQYEQALSDAKAQVVADDTIPDEEVRIDRIAEGILPAAQRFFERVEPKTDEDMLDREFPAWRRLPAAAPTFLLTGDYNLRTLPEQMDFSASIIPYTKAVEVALYERFFAPFRAASGTSDADCANPFLQQYMRGQKELTLGNFMIILSSSKETALRGFISREVPDAATRVFGSGGIATILNDGAMRHIRNKAAHDEVLTRAEAQQIRAWALQILGQV